jgi:CRISPR-associated protein Csm5
MPGMPFTTAPGSKVREQIKDAYDQVYLPGSSLKGALRTMLFWAHFADTGAKPDITLIPERGDPRRAAEQLERSVFVPNPAERRGNAPNYDWLRALHVADSNALPVEGHMQLRTAMIYPTETPKTDGLRVDVEAVTEGAFRVALSIEEYPFEDAAAAEKLAWSKEVERGKLAQLAAIGRRYAEHRLGDEIAYFRRGPAAVLQVMQALLAHLKALPPNAFLLQLGWGAGWEDKTLGIGLLRQRAGEFEGLLEDYHMLKPGTKREPGDPFPKTRAVIMRSKALEAPPGWVEIRL